MAPAAVPTIVVGGKTLATPQPPLNRNGVILLPMRATFEALQATVRWLPRERKIEARRPGRLIELWVGTPVAQVSHAPVQLLAPPVLVKGTAYVPLRFVAEAFGAVVQWDALTQTAFIHPPAGG